MPDELETTPEPGGDPFELRMLLEPLTPLEPLEPGDVLVTGVVEPDGVVGGVVVLDPDGVEPVVGWQPVCAGFCCPMPALRSHS